jgi:DNA repair protein RecN (Recombination protein N)
MLLEVLVENYAVIEKLRLRFHAGFNVLTGETGSGKSIVVDALGLLFGGRTSTDMIRSGADRAHIAGIFEAPRAAVALLAESGIEPEEEEIMIEREILAGGKSRAFVCNRPATAALLRDLASTLGDIHGQHDQQRLFSAGAQLDILDEFANNEELLRRSADVYKRWRDCEAELDELQRMEQEKLRLLDVWTFQRDEIAAARLRAGEDAALEQERKVLQNVGRLLEFANAAYAALYDAPESASAQMKASIRRLEELCRIDTSLEDVLQTLRPAQIAIEDGSAAIRDYLGRLEADPLRLEEVESRLAVFDKLKRKYGSTIEDVIAFGDNVQTQIEAVASASERCAEIERRRAKLAGEFEQLAGQLSARRRTAGQSLAKRVQSELKALAMERTVFQVELLPAPWSTTGADSAQFLVSANVGEAPRPLERVASGGELSRIALALKTCVTGPAKGRTLVFDEVDAGIGGVAAESVGRRLQGLAERNQVLCVTHLAQIAGFAAHHFLVEKKEVKGRTVATVDELSGDARTREIGRMLSGQRLTPEALRHAEQLIRISGEGS